MKNVLNPQHVGVMEYNYVVVIFSSDHEVMVVDKILWI